MAQAAHSQRQWSYMVPISFEQPFRVLNEKQGAGDGWVISLAAYG
jgi:hypothetical protein